ncbi:eukaryotic rRNA processing protein EBP2-domain-containing protein [Biscogniauxia mediterranea]|nr:eukaryotic rRNA processing protein EBP2-domain-containing protein [Biscogniauxia mediterranea]
MAKSKLLTALKHEQGFDAKKLKQLREKKKHKQRIHNKRKHGDLEVSEDDEAPAADDVEDGEEDNEQVDESEDEQDENGVDIAQLDESDSSDSSIDLEDKIERPRKAKTTQAVAASKGSEKNKSKENKDDGEDEDEEEEEEEEEDDEDIPLSDLEDGDIDDEADYVPKQKLSINNTTALLASLNRIAIPTDKSVPFATHQSVVSSGEPTAAAIPDIHDDLKRELALYQQNLEAAKQARALLKAEGVPFSRPTDYFAEMVKDDGHMEKVKAKLIEEASAKKASAEARKLRDLKKFGKQVQVAKLQERQKQKRETLEKIKTLKRKRQESGTGDDTHEADLFDVAVDNELGNKKSQQRAFGRGGRTDGGGGGGGPNAKRQKKNEKYGFGGKKRHAKSGDAVSSGDLSGFSVRRMKSGGGGGAKGKVSKGPRLGKSRRNAGAGKR